MSRRGATGLAFYLLIFGLACVVFGVFIWVGSHGSPVTLLGYVFAVVGVAMTAAGLFVWSRRSR
jgi:hypothetical protein